MVDAATEQIDDLVTAAHVQGLSERQVRRFHAAKHDVRGVVENAFEVMNAGAGKCLSTIRITGVPLLTALSYSKFTPCLAASFFRSAASVDGFRRWLSAPTC